MLSSEREMVICVIIKNQIENRLEFAPLILSQVLTISTANGEKHQLIYVKLY